MQLKHLIFITLLVPFLAFSQKNSSIDVIAGFEYSYRNLLGKSKKNLALIREDETAKVNWRFGFNYNKRLTDKLFLKTGLRFVRTGYNGIKQTDLRWGSEYDDMGGWTPDPSLPHEIQFIYDYYFIEVPIAARYEANKKQLSPFFEFGVYPLVHLTRRIETITDLDTKIEFHENNVTGVNTLHILASVSGGINYAFNDQFQLFGQVAFRHHITKLVDAPLREYLINSGLEFGVRKWLK